GMPECDRFGAATLQLHEQVPLRLFRLHGDARRSTNSATRGEPDRNKWHTIASRSAGIDPQASDRVAKLEVAPSLSRRGLPFCEGVDGKGLLGLLRLPRGSDKRGCARRVGSAELSRYLSHPLAAVRILVREVRSTARFPDCSIGGRRAMRNARSLNALSGIWVLVFAAPLRTPAKALSPCSPFYNPT